MPSSRKLINIFTKHYQLDFKNNAFDFLRLILALGIVYYHARGFIVTNSPWQFIEYKGASDFSMGNVQLGRVEVYLFFIISGFLITMSLERSKNVQDFFEKRIKRIYPAYIVCLLVTILFFLPLTAVINHATTFPHYVKTFWPESLKYLIQNLFDPVIYTGFNQIYDHLNKPRLEINGPVWSLYYEIRAYILIVILSYLGCLKQLWKLLIPLGICWVLYIFYVFGIIESTIINQIYYQANYFLFTYFLFGALAYKCINLIRFNWIYFIISILALIAGLKFDLVPVLFPPAMTYFILFLAATLPFKNISQKFGDLSYGIYIYSWPIQVLLLAIGWPKSFKNYLFMSLLLSVGAGYLSWNLIESRFLKKKLKKNISEPESVVVAL